MFSGRILSEGKEMLVVLLTIVSSDTTSRTNYRKSNYSGKACQLLNPLSPFEATY
jgi:hypothetical protein